MNIPEIDNNCNGQKDDTVGRKQNVAKKPILERNLPQIGTWVSALCH